MISAKEELDKLYLGIGMVQTCAGMVGTAGWSAAYAAVVERGWLVQRLLFVGGCGVLLVSSGSVVVLGRFGMKVRSAGEV